MSLHIELGKKLKALVSAGERTKAYLEIKEIKKILDKHEKFLKTSFVNDGLPDGLTRKVLRVDRKWSDEDTIVSLLQEMGFDNLVQTKPNTVTEVEKVIGTDEFAATFDRFVTRKEVESFVEKTQEEEELEI